MTTHLVWLRNDLRLRDNKALHAACSQANARVLAVFIATPKQWRKHEMSPRQAALIYANLKKLKQEMEKKGIPLYCHQCDDFSASTDWLTEYCVTQKISVLFYNRQYELNEWRRDQEVERRLAGLVSCRHFDDSLLLPPGILKTGTGEMYKVYTSFRNAFIRCLSTSDVQCLPEPQSRASSLPISDAPPLFSYPNADIGEDFPVGEEAALQRLRIFCSQQVQDYLIQRNLPDVAGTSNLSPYLAIGILSPRQCFNHLRADYPLVLKQRESGAFGWLNELIWREFYGNLIAAYPELCRHQPFIAWTNKICWKNNASLLQAWKCGKTGYPIVDAAMRQLNSSGWMHNRLRMISASFLVKNLLIDWRIGERYFMSQLLDGDFAVNNGNWQWAASTGTDSIPYFRIFNPTSQSKRFDPQGAFIRKWLPELTNIPNHAIHEPHLWAKRQHLALNYPLPIIDHQKSRLDTLAAFKSAKQIGFAG